MNNNLFLLSVSIENKIESFLVCIDTDKSNLDDVMNKIKFIHGNDAVPIYFINTEVDIKDRIGSLSDRYEFLMSALRRYMFFDYIINDYRIVTFDEPNRELIKTDIELKLVLYGHFGEKKEKIIDNFINMYYPLAKINKIYANKENIKSILDLIDHKMNTLMITSDLDLSTILSLTGYMINIRMIDNEYNIYKVWKDYNRLNIEPEIR